MSDLIRTVTGRVERKLDHTGRGPALRFVSADRSESGWETVAAGTFRLRRDPDGWLLKPVDARGSLPRAWRRVTVEV